MLQKYTQIPRKTSAMEFIFSGVRVLRRSILILKYSVTDIFQNFREIILISFSAEHLREVGKLHYSLEGVMKDNLFQNFEKFHQGNQRWHLYFVKS